MNGMQMARRVNYMDVINNLTGTRFDWLIQKLKLERDILRRIGCKWCPGPDNFVRNKVEHLCLLQMARRVNYMDVIHNLTGSRFDWFR